MRNSLPPALPAPVVPFVPLLSLAPVLLALFSLPLLPGPTPLAAQAPEVTPDGDPTVLSDTIYSLAVDPADHPEEAGVVLLDDGLQIREEDGTGSRTYRTVAQVLTREAVEGWAEHTIGYDGQRETFRLNWVRVLDLEGNVISEEPVHMQTMDAPVPEQSPIYTDRKRVRFSLGGVEPGTIVDYSYTVTTNEPVREGEWGAYWRITTGGTILRSRYRVDVPEGYDLRVVAAPGTVEPVVHRGDGREVYEWAMADLPRVPPEMFQRFDLQDDFQRIRVGSPGTWEAVGRWYRDLAADRYELTDEVLAAAEEVVAEAEGVEALRELHRWIAQDLRYVSVSLGVGGYQPRLPAEVLRTRSGDCKDKATLFIALARHHGFEAYPVLLHSTSGVVEELPGVREFDHAIAAVRIDGDWVYLDLTAAIVPFGEIPPGYAGEFGLVVMDDGSVEEITFPRAGAEDNQSHMVLRGELFEDGSFEGELTSTHTGAAQYTLRSTFAREFAPRELDEIAQVAARVVEGGRPDSLEAFDGLDLEADVALHLGITSGRATRPNVGGGQIFVLPLDNYANPGLVEDLEGELETRRSPIDVDEVSGPASSVSELHLTLPEGWTAQLPDDVVAESRFGTYEARYDQRGRELSVLRRFVGATGVAPKESLPELIEWIREISRDDVPFLLLEPGAE